MKISAVIITYNEEMNIADCLASVKAVADEIVVVDSFSTDATERICREYGARFFTHRFEGHIQQKNFAMEQASNDIVLSLDADERLDGQLTKEILLAKSRWNGDAFSMNRLNNYCGKFIHFGEWNPDWKIRLWDRRKGRWGGENPHDKVIMLSGVKLAKFRGRLLHYTYRNVAQHFQQMQKFSDIAAAEAFAKGKKPNVLIHQAFYPLFTFLKIYFFKLGFLDGYEGFVLAIHGAYYRFLKYTKLRQLWLQNTC